jgi:hypothetical protein
MLLLLAFRVFSHETPSDRLVASRDIISGNSVFDTIHLETGQILRVNFHSSGGVLALLDPSNFAVYFGLSSGAAEDVWSTSPSDLGFYHFGQFLASVEIVALTSAFVSFAASFIGPSDCSTVYSASSATYSLSTTESSRLCFIATDLNTTADITGILNTTIVTINGTDHPADFSIHRSDFRLITVSAGDPLDFTCSFRAGNPKYDYDPVSADSPVGLIGKGKQFSFVRFLSDPYYPPLDRAPDRFGFISLVMLLMSFGFLFVGTFLLCAFRWMYVRREMEWQEQPKLYDDQGGHNLEAPEVSDSGAEDEAREEVEPMPDSPYEAAPLGYL